MKRVILCIIIFIALCGLAAGSYLYIIGSTTRLLNKVEFVAQNFTDGDYDAAFTAAREADEMWTDFRKRSFLVINRDDITEITATLARITSLSDEQILVECNVAIALLRQYEDKQRINFYNIL